MRNSDKKLDKQHLIDGGIQTIQKRAYCLNYSKLKTSLFTGSRNAIAKQQCIIFHFALNVSIRSLPSDIFPFHSIELKAIWTLWKTMEQTLITSSAFITKNNNYFLILGIRYFCESRDTITKKQECIVSHIKFILYKNRSSFWYLVLPPYNLQLSTLYRKLWDAELLSPQCWLEKTVIICFFFSKGLYKWIKLQKKKRILPRNF